MGKKEINTDDSYSKNIPLNPSLSYSLNHLITKVRLQKFESHLDEWRPYSENPFVYEANFVYEKNFSEDSKRVCYRSSQEIAFDASLSLKNQKTFLDFFNFLKKKMFISGSYILNSSNNFFSSAGAASSASSFSALTLATYKLAKDVSSRKDYIDSLTQKDLSAISRLGSGSSCRSFFFPWAYWEGKFAIKYQCPFEHLIHQLIVIDRGAKSVSSREAHARVIKSPRFKGRIERSKNRLNELSKALQLQDWARCFKISWEEFVDMHHLFETSDPSFKYKNDSSEEVLNQLNDFWQAKKDGPIVTMDAGANIHLLYRKDQKRLAQDIEKLFSSYLVLSSDIERNL